MRYSRKLQSSPFNINTWGRVLETILWDLESEHCERNHLIGDANMDLSGRDHLLSYLILELQMLLPHYYFLSSTVEIVN